MPEGHYFPKPEPKPYDTQSAACGVPGGSPEQVGQMVGGFIRGLLGSPVVSGASTCDSYAAFPPDYQLWGDVNNAANLEEGKLLIVHLAKNRCYLVDPESGDITFLFSLNWGPRTFMWRA